jgi:hypothetical protein
MARERRIVAGQDMSETEARTALRSIADGLNEMELWFRGTAAQLLEFEERRGFAVLGYKSMSKCVEAELETSRQRAHQLLTAARTKAVLSTAVDTVDKRLSTAVDGMTEYAVRPLTRLEPAKASKAFIRAAELADGTPMESHVRAAVAEVVPSAAPKPRPQETPPPAVERPPGSRKCPCCGGTGYVTPAEVDEAFEDWYARYPRKVGKAAARRAWMTALRQDVEPSHLVDRVTAYASAVAAWDDGDSRFVPHPSTWLNGARYDDDPVTWERPDDPNANPRLMSPAEANAAVLREAGAS